MNNLLFKKKMVFTGGKETFILRALMDKVKASQIDCKFVPFNVDDINTAMEDVSLLAIYMDETIKLKEDILHFLVDSLEEKSGKLILIGEQIDLNYVTGLVTDEIIYKTFSRPVNNEDFVSSINDYFNKSDSGEFKKSILIVDDDPHYLTIVRQWLKNDYKVAMANSGLQAIKYLGKNKVDLILLDNEMPVTSGPQVLEMLRSDAETSSIPVIFLTGKSDKESVMAVVSLRPEGYFLKNIQKDELLEKLKEFFVLNSVKG
ncbi:response regulator [Butyrivibrio sp. YAB3001]|uniref:response regulator n=1 Tax=Butyrivibrio sp. YAB3001 TaxID=1520812 RepID=UPI001FA885D4|nr:response regulator [Butyrivibrio sp. YAB3001]